MVACKRDDSNGRRRSDLGGLPRDPNCRFLGKSQQVHSRWEERPSISNTDVQHWLAAVFGLCFCVVYLLQGYEAEVAVVIVLVGVGKFAVNWGTGEWSYQLLAFQLPCFSKTHSLYGPWIVAAYIPLGAIIFLHRR